MTRSVFGLVLYGIPDPSLRGGSTVPCLYTTGALPVSGRPAELASAVIQPLVKGLPGLNWGATPREPAGSGGSCTVRLSDTDAQGQPRGLLGQLFLEDRAAPFWGVESNRIEATDTTITLVNAAEPQDDVTYYLGNECVTVTLTSGPTRGYTRGFDMTRGLCGSFATTHVMRPSDYSEGEDGSQDRLYLRSKPDWSAGFYCGVYLFLLNDRNEIVYTTLRRGVVAGQPTQTQDHGYDISIKFIEDCINSHTVGEVSKETTLSRLILVHKLDTSEAGISNARPQEVSILLQLAEAEAFFNEPLAPRGGTRINQAMLTDLSERLFADSDLTYQVKVKNDAEWVYDITGLSYYAWVSNNTFYEAVKVSCVLTDEGYAPDSSCLVRKEEGGDTWLQFKPWYNNNLLGSGPNAQGGSNVIISGTSTGGPPPLITLRLRMQKTLVQAFLTLCISIDGSSGDPYDKLIGGLGAGLPEDFFSLGSASLTPLTILGNTIQMLQLDQLLNPVNDYYFDCSKGISLKDFLSNEFIGAQLLLGSLQSGLIALRSWIHEVAATETIHATNTPQETDKRLTAMRTLDLFYGTRILDLEPAYHRSIRYLGTTTVQKDEVQPLRVWRQGLRLGPGGVVNIIDVFGLLRAFYQVFGGNPRVFPVVMSLEDFITQQIEFADAVHWSDPMVDTPSGLGFDADCFVVGIDCNYEAGLCKLLLIENTLYTAPTETEVGNIAPSLKILSVANVNPTTVDVEVDTIDGSTFDPIADFGGLYDSIQNNQSYLMINNLYQSPIGPLETIGDLVAYCKIDTITPGSPNVFRLVVDAAWIRGASVATVDDLFVVGETRLNLPPRVPAEANLEGVLIEPDVVALPDDQNFVTFMPLRPLLGVSHTFDH